MRPATSLPTANRFRSWRSLAAGLLALGALLGLAGEARAQSLPGAPTNLTAAAGPDRGEVTLSWNVPGNNGGAAITDYKYRKQKTSTTIWDEWVPTGGTGTEHTVTGLDDSTEYGFQVRAVNSVGDGPASNRGTATTLTLDWAALVALYNATDGAYWSTNTNWTSTTAALSTWHGVTTDSDGRVTQLSLSWNGLSGAIPAELGDLTSLQRLNLSQNGLTGTIPAALGDLTSLQHLNLYGNILSGAIPAALGDLANLEELHLEDNSLSGAIPPELGDLTNLEELYLWGNGLSGTIPAELGDLANLEELHLWGNGLSGAIPAALGDLANLEELHLDGNILSGAIPAALGNLANLEELHLWGNILSGAIPAALGDLASLQELSLYRNELSGAIPPELGDLASLTSLRLDDNSLSGSIPAALGDLVNLNTLYLWGNELSGSIPAALGNLTNLQRLRLDQNELSGALPGTFLGLSQLLVLDIRSTDLCAPADTAFQAWLATITFQGPAPNGAGRAHKSDGGSHRWGGDADLGRAGGRRRIGDHGLPVPDQREEPLDLHRFHEHHPYGHRPRQRHGLRLPGAGGQQNRQELFFQPGRDHAGSAGSVHPGLYAFRQWEWHHLRSGVRERRPPAGPSRYLFLRHGG